MTMFPERFWGRTATGEARDRYELMTQRLREVADHAVSTAQEAPPFKAEKVSELIGQGDPDRNLMQIRLLLGAPGPDYGSTPAPALAGEADREAVERALEASGLPQVGGISRDLAFHAAVGNVADDLVRRIGLMMGGEVSATHAHLLHGLIERVAHATGPQLTIEAEGPDGP